MELFILTRYNSLHPYRPSDSSTSQAKKPPIKFRDLEFGRRWAGNPTATCTTGLYCLTEENWVKSLAHAIKSLKTLYAALQRTGELVKLSGRTRLLLLTRYR